MGLNHLDLAVPDVAATRAFFETYFGFRCLADRVNQPSTICPLGLAVPDQNGSPAWQMTRFF